MRTALISFLRNFRKRKVIYSITLIGFGIALAIFVLITSFVIEEKSVDKHLPHLAQMYRVLREGHNPGVPKRYYDRLKNQMPEIETVGMYNKNGISFKYEDKPYHASYLGMTQDCIELFEIKFIRGSKESVFDAKTGIAITESFSKEIFGEENPIGKEIEINNEIRIITAIVNDPPKTFSIKYDFLWHNDYNTAMSFWCYGSNFPDDCYHVLETAFVINENANITEVENKLNNLLSDCRIYKEEKISLQKYEEIYFDTRGGWDGHEKANVRIIKLLSIVALIILVLAILNYINLATAANKERFKEICVRKTSGARNFTIIKQFMIESYIACFISLGIGIFILLFFSSSFNEIFGKEFRVFESLKNANILVVVLAIVIVVGGISGVFPAIAASFYHPLKLIQKNTGTKRIETRGIFNSVQFLISISIIICLIIINKQLKYVKTADVGFNTDQLLAFRMDDLDIHVAAIRDKLYESPNIKQICASEGKIFNLRLSGSSTIKADGKEFNSGYMRYLKTDWNLLTTIDVPLIEGRDFRKTDKNVCMINEHFYREMGWGNLENKFIGGNEVVGVFREIHYESFHKEIGKLHVEYEPYEPDLDIITVRIDGRNIPNTIAHIKSVMKSFDPHFELNYQFYDELINKLYKQEEKQAKAVKIFALIAILLSCLGLYGMVVFSCTNRIKEIGIRKVNGAKTKEIMAMINMGFIKWILISFIFASPIAWFAMQKWLGNFAYKTSLDWWIFALAGIMVMGVAVLTVGWHSWRAASRNPVEALRYE